MKLSFAKNRHIERICLFLIYFIIPFLLYFATSANGNLIVSGDGAGFFSFKEYFNTSVMNGSFPYWCPYMQNGAPFIADLSFAPLYPIGWVLFWLPLKYYVLVYYSIHTAIAGFFMNKYLRELKCDGFVSFAVALLFSLSICLGGYRKSHMGIISTAVWIPVIFYFVQRYINSKNIKYLLISAIAMALQFMAGFIQITFYTDIIIGIYLLAYMRKDKMKLSQILRHGFMWVISYMLLICVQLLPMLVIMSFYSSKGSLSTPYDTFISYSISFRKIAMMIFPNIFGADIYKPYGIMYSSEMDIELFVGIGIVIICATTVVLYFKKFIVKLITLLSAGIFIYAANAHVPFLSKILFRIPIFSGFRVPSRILFIFIFMVFTLFALGLQFLKVQKEKSVFLKTAVLVYLMITVAACLSYSIINSGLFTPELAAYYADNDVFVKSLLVGLILVAVLAFYVYKDSKKYFNVFLIVLAAATLFQTFPYYKLYAPVSSASFELTENENKIKGYVGNGMLWYPSQTQAAYFKSFVGFSKSFVSRVQTLNCYTTFNNPALYRMFNNNSYAYMNYSGLYTWFPMGETNLIMQNDELSMLGVDVIADSEGIVSGDAVKTGKVKQQVFSENSIDVPNMNGKLFVYSKEFAAVSGMVYKIEFEADSEKDADSIYIDLYGENYDNPAQDYKFHIIKGSKKYTGYVYSGKVPDGKPVSVRVIGTPVCNTKIRNFTVSSMDTAVEKGVYTPILKDGGYIYYKNNNAKDILYFSENVKNIESEDDFFSSVIVNDMLNTSYIQGTESQENLGEGKIEITNRDENSIYANVTLDKDGFLNFGQNYFPGWRAYIDNNEAKLYTVNGIIQGIFVPKGTHTICFKYIPKYFYAGAGISLAGLIAIAGIILNSRMKIKGIERGQKNERI